MTFTPVKDPPRQAVTPTKDRTITVELGIERKARLIAVCKREGVTVTRMLRQMIDYCLDEIDAMEEA